MLACNNNDSPREEIPTLYTIRRYPAEWVDCWTMHDGSVVTVCPILPQDALLKAALVKGLSSESCYARFLVGGGRLTDKMLAAYTQVDYVDHTALVVSVARLDGTSEDPIADGRFVVEDGVAEFAMPVADARQGKDVGRRLLATLMCATWMPGTREVFSEVLSINRHMTNLTRDAGFRMANVPGDAMVCTVHSPLAQAEVAITSFAFA